MKIGIIGFGNQAKKIQIRLNKKKYINKIYIYKPNKFVEKSNKKNIYTNNILELKLLDCVFICSNSETHIKYIKFFLQKIKHIFCEKPGVTNRRDYYFLNNLPKNLKKKIYFNYNYLFSEYFKLIAAELSNKKNGKLINFTFYTSHGAAFFKKKTKNYKNIFKNILGNLGIHYINFLLKKLPNIKITKYKTLSIANKNIDTAKISLKDKSICGDIFLSYASVAYKFFILHFTNCILIFDNNKLKKISPRNTFTKNGLFKTPPSIFLKIKDNNHIRNSLDKSLEYFLKKVKESKFFRLKDYNRAMNSSKILIDVIKK